MKRVYILALSLVVLACLSASATVINVPDDYPTIQQGIDASTDGDSVLVQPGTYMENINFNGHNIVLASLFLTTDDPAYIYDTTIDGETGGTTITLDSGEGPTTMITGFTILNGFGEFGGRILCDGASPVIRMNIISATSEGFIDKGGGIYCNNSGALIETNGISFNSSCWGGGIYCQNSQLCIFGNAIAYNDAFQ